VSLNREPERLLRDSEEDWRTEKLPAKVLCRVYTGGDTTVACLCVNRGDGGFPNIVMTYRVTVPFGLRSRARARGKFGTLFGPKLMFHFCVSPMRPSENFPPLLVRR
jgi:hypothetical protein